MSKVPAQIMERAASSLVERARYGDQNAMGMIAMIGQAAKKGHPRAKVAATMIERNIKRNPIQSAWFNTAAGSEQNGGKAAGFLTNAFAGQFGVDADAASTSRLPGVSPLVCSAVQLANGPPIDDQCSAIAAMRVNWGDEELKQFEFGVEHWRSNKPAPVPVVCGRAIGYALTLQNTRNDENSDLSEWGPAVAWELGY